MIGIYQIKCLMNDRIYIGGTTDIDSRFLVHRGTLRRGQHRNRHLQEDYDKHGESQFEYSILEKLEDKNDLDSREQFYLDSGECLYANGGYNILIKVGSPEGVSIHDEESRKILSEKKLGEKNPFYQKTHSDEYKLELSKRQSGEGNVKAKLTWEKVNNIRKMIEDNISMREIIGIYGISESTFYKIKSKRAWKDDNSVTPTHSR